MFKCFGCCGTGQQASGQVQESRPDFLTLDYRKLADEISIHFKNLESLWTEEPYTTPTNADDPAQLTYVWKYLSSIDILREVFSEETPNNQILETYFRRGEMEASSLSSEILKIRDRGNEVRVGIVVGLLCVGHVLMEFYAIKQNADECYAVMKECCRLARLLKQLNYVKKRDRLQMREASRLLVAGSIMCWIHTNPSRLTSPWLDPSSTVDSLTAHKVSLESMCLKLYETFDVHLYPQPREHLPGRLGASYPNYAVGIEDDIKDLIDVMEWGNKRRTMAIILHGCSGSGKTTLADAVFATVELPYCNYAKISVFDNSISSASYPGLDWVRFPNEGNDVRAFIYIDNALKKQELEELVRKLLQHLKDARQVRILVTARNLHESIDWNQFLQPECIVTHETRPRNMQDSFEIFKSAAGMDFSSVTDEQKEKLREVSKGSPGWLFLAGKIIAGIKGSNQSPSQTDTGTLLESLLSKQNQAGGDIVKLVEDMQLLDEEQDNNLGEICCFFHDFPWKHVQHVVGEQALEDLQQTGMISKVNSRVHVLHPIFQYFITKSREYWRTLHSVEEAREYIEKIYTEVNQGLQNPLRGIIFGDANTSQTLNINTSFFAAVHRNLKVLKVAKWSTFSDVFLEPFESLICYESPCASDPLPFDLNKTTNLRRLVHAGWNFNMALTQLPSSLRFLNLTTSEDPFQSVLRDPANLSGLRILSLNLQCTEEVRLPPEISSLQLEELEIICETLEELPETFGQLQSLQMLRLSCPKIPSLPDGFGQLSNLTDLDLEGCVSLQMFCDDFFNLAALNMLHLGEFHNLPKTYVIDIIKMQTLNVLFVPRSWFVCFAGRELPSHIQIYYPRNYQHSNDYLTH